MQRLAADWWSLGALMFDMLTGEPPFSAPTKRETQELILRGRISQPTGVSAQAKDLLKNLLKRNHLTRLGSGERDALDIQVCFFIFSRRLVIQSSHSKFTENI